MSDRVKGVLALLLVSLAVIIFSIWWGVKQQRDRERQEKVLTAVVCLSRCGSYNDGCCEACGEDAACQERCDMRFRTCINGCRH